MNIEILNLQHIIKELTKKNEELQKENENLKEQLEESNNAENVD